MMIMMIIIESFEISSFSLLVFPYRWIEATADICKQLCLGVCVCVCSSFNVLYKYMYVHTVLYNTPPQKINLIASLHLHFHVPCFCLRGIHKIDLEYYFYKYLVILSTLHPSPAALHTQRMKRAKPASTTPFFRVTYPSLRWQRPLPIF